MRTSRSSAALLVPAAVTLALLAGCDSSGSDTATGGVPSPATSDAPAAGSPSPNGAEAAPQEPVRALPDDYRYLCDLVPADEVSRTSGIDGLTVAPDRTSIAQLPPRDLCRYVDPATQATITVGVGVLPGTPAALDAARKSQPYLQALDLPELGDGAYFAPRSGTIAFLAGDTILEVSYEGAPVTREQLIATGELLADSVEQLQPAPAKVVVPVCDELVDEVEAVLGGPADVRRDKRLGESVNCGFATTDTFVSVGHIEQPGQAQLLRDYFTSLPGVTKVPGLGKQAYFAVGQGGVVLDEDVTAGIHVEPAPSMLTPELEALLRAATDFA